MVQPGTRLLARRRLLVPFAEGGLTRAGCAASAGNGVLDDGEGPARPPRPAPAQCRFLAAADRPIQYDMIPRRFNSFIAYSVSRLRLSQNWIGRCRAGRYFG